MALVDCLTLRDRLGCGAAVEPIQFALSCCRGTTRIQPTVLRRGLFARHAHNRYRWARKKNILAVAPAVCRYFAVGMCRRIVYHVAMRLLRVVTERNNASCTRPAGEVLVPFPLRVVHDEVYALYPVICDTSDKELRPSPAIAETNHDLSEGRVIERCMFGTP